MLQVTMENKIKMLAVEETIKIEVGEVKVETAEIDSGLFGAEQITWGLAVKDDTDENTDEIVLNRMKNQHNYVKAWRDEKVFEMQEGKIKLEKDLDCRKFEIGEITEEFIIKNEDDCNSFMDPNTKIVLNGALNQKLSRRQYHVLCKKASSKSYSCYNCSYTAYYKYLLINHMKQHKNRKRAYLHSSKLSTNLDNHKIQKHPSFIASVCSKIHQCTHCNKTFTIKRNLDEHTVSKHPDHIASISRKIHECTYCAYKTATKVVLDEHTIRKHPHFIASVSSKIHQCTYCTYKTTNKSNLDKHMPKHVELVDSYKLRCIHCDKAYINKIGLDDHIIKEHPTFIESVSTKIQECTHCAYKTTKKSSLDRHMLKHPETADRFKMSMCIHCNKTFTSKRSLYGHTIRKHPDHIASISTKIHECTYCAYKTDTKFKLDEHTVRHHPDFIASVSSKIHQCTYCTYKTASKSNLDRHMSRHVKLVDRDKLRCIHCDKAYTTKMGLDDHTVRKHPHFIASVSSKIHQCTYCTYKTASKYSLDKHMLKHVELVDRDKFRCIHCDKVYTTKIGLDDHTIRKHPHFIASVSSKIYQCTYCTYKTASKYLLDKHMSRHVKLVDRDKLRCIHCDKAYTTKMGLDDHTIRKHPHFIASVSSKIHQCTYCTYKTANKFLLNRHMPRHVELELSHKLRCIHCDKAYTNKIGLDDHTIREHPDFIESVSTKIHECTHCAYKTTKKSSLDRHMLKHPETAV